VAYRTGGLNAQEAGHPYAGRRPQDVGDRRNATPAFLTSGIE
jgi:hypothetical protein